MRLGYMAAILCCCFTVIGIAAIAVGQQQPPNIWVSILHLDKCELPCWIGIVPGQTTMQEAVRRFRSVYDNPDLYTVEPIDDFWFQVIHLPTKYRFHVSLESKYYHRNVPSTVQQIWLYPMGQRGSNSQIPTIGDFYSRLGDPSALRLATGVDRPTVVLLYSYSRIQLAAPDLECDRVIPQQKVYGIRLVQLSDEMVDAWLSIVQDWHGFNRCYNFVRDLLYE